MKEIEVNIDLRFDLDELRRDFLADFDAATTTKQEDKVLYACAGNALYRAQLLEMDLNIIARIARVFAGEFCRSEQYCRFEDSLEGKPLGFLLSSAWEAVQVDVAAQQVVEAGRTARNELCHGFFQTNAESMHTRDGRLEVLSALIDINLKLREASFITTATYKGLMHAYGLTEQAFDDQD